MKKIAQIIAVLIISLMPVLLSAQPLPDDGSSGGGESGTPIGGGATIGGGLIIIASLAIGYGSKKIYDARKKTID